MKKELQLVSIPFVVSFAFLVSFCCIIHAEEKAQPSIPVVVTFAEKADATSCYRVVSDDAVPASESQKQPKPVRGSTYVVGNSIPGAVTYVLKSKDPVTAEPKKKEPILVVGNPIPGGVTYVLKSKDPVTAEPKKKPPILVVGNPLPGSVLFVFTSKGSQDSVAAEPKKKEPILVVGNPIPGGVTYVLSDNCALPVQIIWPTTNTISLNLTKNQMAQLAAVAAAGAVVLNYGIKIFQGAKATVMSAIGGFFLPYQQLQMKNGKKDQCSVDKKESKIYCSMGEDDYTIYQNSDGSSNIESTNGIDLFCENSEIGVVCTPITG